MTGYNNLNSCQSVAARLTFPYFRWTGNFVLDDLLPLFEPRVSSSSAKLKFDLPRRKIISSEKRLTKYFIDRPIEKAISSLVKIAWKEILVFKNSLSVIVSASEFSDEDVKMAGDILKNWKLVGRLQTKSTNTPSIFQATRFGAGKPKRAALIFYSFRAICRLRLFRYNAFTNSYVTRFFICGFRIIWLWREITIGFTRALRFINL